MKKKVFYLMLTLVVISATGVNGQVLIGGNMDDEPHAGAILDLASGGQNNLGLLLPNVKLSGSATKFELKQGASEEEKQTATGMIVYNTADVLYGPGIYIWNGASWTLLDAGNNSPCPRTIGDAEDNAYSVGDFGAAGCWMTQNLRSKKTPAGVALTSSANSSYENAPYYYYPNGNYFNPNPAHGLTYTWAAANTGMDPADTDEVPVNRQGICPAGWHLPNKNEWNQLVQVIGDDEDQIYSSREGKGAALQKMVSKTPVTTGASTGESNAHNENGFDALLTGRTAGTTIEWGKCAYFWLASSSGQGGILDVAYGYPSLSPIVKYGLLSVRCKKN
ncbi:MAG: fibrobacter succinogenes major paralogous domain-containing protein [Dysgonamonadaceae bacterium]|jgi:uncharacterized protein (TIGR02145 family)|nr:fibrobacter succinogenes major paralogous domain-containing protein [Dysgonamonadaceae bacterium]